MDDPHRVAWTGDALLRAKFPEQADVVPGFFVEGLTILAGPPKLGKSWLALQAGLDISRGEEFLEQPVRPGTEVLYLTLEDGPRRLKNRIRASMDSVRMTSFTGASGGIRDGLHLFTKWEEGERGLAILRLWLKRHPTVKFVVVDTLAVLRGESSKAGYAGDYKVMRGLKDIADSLAISILAITHTRKTRGVDPFDMIMGSSGTTGAADTLMVMLPLTPDRKLAALHVRGRDVEGAILEVKLMDARWFLTGAAADARREERARERTAVLDCLAAEGAAGLTASEAGVMADVSTSVATRVLESAVLDGVVRRAVGADDDRFVWITSEERRAAGLD